MDGMSDLEVWLITTVAGLSIAVIGFLMKAHWERAKNNQERIDKSVVETVSESKDRLNKIDTLLAIHARDIAGLKEDVGEQKIAWRTNNDGISRLTNTIQKFDITLENNTKVMHEVLNSLKK